MDHYLKKQLLILTIFLVIVAIFGTGFYFLVNRPPKATCFDGIKNQKEQEVDCGGSCEICQPAKEPLKIIFQEFISTIENNFDLIAEIRNLNSDWGVSSFEYNFDLYNESGRLILSREGSAYILPQETKYIIEPRVYLVEKPVRSELKLKNIIWKESRNFSSSELKVRDEKLGADILFGVVENRTNYDLNKVELVGVIFGANNEIIAAGKTEVNTLLRGENRYFEINWPNQINEEVVSYEIKAYTDVFSPDNFINIQNRSIQQ